MNFLKIATLLSFVKKLCRKGNQMQSNLDKEIESKILLHDKTIFEMPAYTDVYLKRSKHDYHFCLRSKQYKAISEFQHKNDLSKAEISMALRTRLIKLSSKNKPIICIDTLPPLHTMYFGITALAASTIWYFCCKNFQLFAPIDALASGLGNLLTAIIYLALMVFLIFNVISYYADGFIIRARFKEMKLRK